MTAISQEKFQIFFRFFDSSAAISKKGVGPPPPRHSRSRRSATTAAPLSFGITIGMTNRCRTHSCWRDGNLPRRRPSPPGALSVDYRVAACLCSGSWNLCPGLSSLSSRRRCRSRRHKDKLTYKLSNTICAEVTSCARSLNSSMTRRWRSIRALHSATRRSASSNSTMRSLRS
jgi:hypothetical protein